MVRDIALNLLQLLYKVGDEFMKENTCCFFGHRTIAETDELRKKITEAVERLITDKRVDTFLFGSKSQFDSLCLEVVTKLKEKYPQVKRIYLRAEFEFISEDYLKYLLNFYDDTYFLPKLHGAGRAVYVERNCEMINNSKYCIVYYDKDYSPPVGKSGTRIALDYATERDREIIMMLP